MPTLDEINAAAPDTPGLHPAPVLTARCSTSAALARSAATRKDTPNPPGGLKSSATDSGNPTGLLIARPNATDPLRHARQRAEAPVRTHQMNSTRHFMRELNRLGLTSIIDAGGGFQNYPDDYAVIDATASNRRTDPAHRLQSLHPEAEAGERRTSPRWIKMTGPGKGDDYLRCNGAGEMLVFSRR